MTSSLASLFGALQGTPPPMLTLSWMFKFGKLVGDNCTILDAETSPGWLSDIHA